MARTTLSILAEQLVLADALSAGRDKMFDPQDLPGRYGRVVRAVDCVLGAIDCEAVVGGGWAVWRHGFVNRVTQDIDIILPASRVEDFLRAASVSGFEILPVRPGHWPKVRHKETDVQVDVLPEGQHPGVPPELAPTSIPPPSELGAAGAKLVYIGLSALVELKIAAGRFKDKSDVVELIRENLEQIDTIRQHLSDVHPTYVTEFDALVNQARNENGSR